MVILENSEVSFVAPEQTLRMKDNMEPQCLSFSKQLQKSHLCDKYYLGFPKKFCDAHLPNHKNEVILVDENEQEYRTTYRANKNRLRGGWKAFAVAHDLLEGDTLVFHQIEPFKFKVHIARASRYTTDDFRNTNVVDFVENDDIIEENGGVADSHQVVKKPRLVHVVKPINTVYSFDSYVFPEDTRYSEAVLSSHVKDFENFEIHVNGKIVDFEISLFVKVKYYELCFGRKMNLHEGLIRGLSTKLSCAIITESTEIADSIRSASPTTPQHQLECWDKTLKAFEDLGMVVDFLRARVRKLVDLYAQVNEQKRDMEDKISKLKALLKTVTAIQGSVVDMEDDIDALKERNEELDLMFMKVASSLWY